MMMCLMSAPYPQEDPKRFIVDRPFYYALRVDYGSTHAHLFQGAVPMAVEFFSMPIPEPPPKPFHVDRPFYYSVRAETASGSIDLFQGVAPMPHD
ncbi:unnamed protein product [Bemisia tabaci]|uniref:Uncharacterized protein n=1 Tax=Bemisia tabaci TaxID=7038 RepID=A0A9P0APE0_BEMTA|nr:unnamed protein product [Bemisia tabaci]